MKLRKRLAAVLLSTVMILTGLTACDGTNPAGPAELTWQNSVVAANRPVQGEKGRLFSMEFYDRTAELAALGVLLTINCILAPQESRRLG